MNRLANIFSLSTARTARPRAQLRAGRQDWYKITVQASEADIMLYDEIGYYGVTAKDFVDEITALNVDQINLRINSPGGAAFDGVAIYQALKDHKARVNVQVDSLAASAASFIAMAGDSVVMCRNSTMMIHDAQGLVIGNAKEVRDVADLLDRYSDNIADIYMQRAGGTLAEWRDRMQTETWYNAQEAVDAGLADEVKGVNSSGEDAVQNGWDLSIFNYASRQQAPAPKITKANVSSTINTDNTDLSFSMFARVFQEVPK